MREATEAEKIQYTYPPVNPFLYDLQIAGWHIPEDNTRPFRLPRHITTALEIVNGLNQKVGSVHAVTNIGRQFGKALTIATVQQIMIQPIPEPEPRNWYREYLYPFTRPRKPDQIPDPIGDLTALREFIKNPTPAQLAARQFAVDYFLFGPQRPDKFREASRGIKGRWQS